MSLHIHTKYLKYSSRNLEFHHKNFTKFNFLFLPFFFEGNAVILTDPKEIAAAKKALFSRHPAMASWSKAHEFKFLKLNITNVLIIDFFGGWVTVPVDEYMKAKP